ncbi:Glycogen debranching enzyme [Sphingomonas jeddahensis]|uniref:Glycogen debranching enzyme n=1 Tax=Sphingomonas jeddahensis TaxID=1915074 RepID=A0A1V2EZ06_9SPHN|nr:Glycogen debranching enzyme [Sphingomonas jeddahensis]
MSWNAGVEGLGRDADVRALLATLFASRGTIMLAPGDEFGRTQCGNNNAYAQDNEVSWLDWAGRDRELEDYVASLAAWRRAHPEISKPLIRHDLRWQALDGCAMEPWMWADASGFDMSLQDGASIRIDRNARAVTLSS